MWYTPTNPNAPIGAIWPTVAPRCSFAPPGVPIGRSEEESDGGMGNAEKIMMAEICTWFGYGPEEDPTHPCERCGEMMPVA